MELWDALGDELGKLHRNICDYRGGPALLAPLLAKLVDRSFRFGSMRLRSSRAHLAGCPARLATGAHHCVLIPKTQIFGEPPGLSGAGQMECRPNFRSVYSVRVVSSSVPLDNHDG